MKTTKRNQNLCSKSGFTIVEVMIVLAVAGLIVLILFFAIPALQRMTRNTRRDNDVQLIVAAINECVLNNNGQIDGCQAFGNIPIDASNLSIFSGAHYGVDASGNSVAPTEEEPNWLFNLRCNSDGTWFLSDNPQRAFVVT